MHIILLAAVDILMCAATLKQVACGLCRAGAILDRAEQPVRLIAELLQQHALIIGDPEDVVVRILQDEVKQSRRRGTIVIPHDLVNIIQSVDVLAMNCHAGAIVDVVLDEAMAVVVIVVRDGRGAVDDLDGPPTERIVFVSR